jgi:cytochrome c oxidase subunit 2|tara:strand:- start:2218 stop:2877 length:660 start_codon:yes stop_codon:yes gene_type:complete
MNRFAFLNISSKSLLSIGGLVLSLLTCSVNANQPPPSYAQCVACHGEQGQGNKQLKAPTLAGQSANYLTRQLINFSSELRGSHEKDIYGQQMLAITKALDLNKDVSAISAYLSALSPTKVNQETIGDLKNGSRYYQAKCGACHGGKAQGNKAFKAPKLSGQDNEYLQRQMKYFAEGIRGTDPKDKLGRQMAMMSKTTSGKELDDILYYISQQHSATIKE